jgi:hypothetical protein
MTLHGNYSTTDNDKISIQGNFTILYKRRPVGASELEELYEELNTPAEDRAILPKWEYVAIEVTPDGTKTWIDGKLQSED